MILAAVLAHAVEASPPPPAAEPPVGEVVLAVGDDGEVEQVDGDVDADDVPLRVVTRHHQRTGGDEVVVATRSMVDDPVAWSVSVRADLDPGWEGVRSPQGAVTTRGGGGTRVQWSGVVVPGVTGDTHTSTLRADRSGGPPDVEVVAAPVAPRSVAQVDELVRDSQRRRVDAEAAAALGAVQAGGVLGLGDGAGELAVSLEEAAGGARVIADQVDGVADEVGAAGAQLRQVRASLDRAVETLSSWRGRRDEVDWGRLGLVLDELADAPEEVAAGSQAADALERLAQAFEGVEHLQREVVGAVDGVDLAGVSSAVRQLEDGLGEAAEAMRGLGDGVDGAAAAAGELEDGAAALAELAEQVVVAEQRQSQREEEITWAVARSHRASALHVAEHGEVSYRIVNVPDGGASWVLWVVLAAAAVSLASAVLGRGRLREE